MTQYTGFFMSNDWDDKIWRKLLVLPKSVHDSVGDEDAAASYRRAWLRFALHLMEDAANASEDDPLWGPVPDPLSSIHATVTWNAGVTEGT
mgnify:CR=1 FL=1